MNANVAKCMKRNLIGPDEPDIRIRPGLNNPSYVTAMSHFYRGELSRIMVWRQRLDVTTTWAITTTTTIIGAAFSFRDLPHIIFFFNLAIVWVMLWIEGRRYRFYDAFRGRVRMLETHFLVPIVLQNPRILDGEWERLVCEDLLLPSFKISKLEAIGRRLKRNYAFIFSIILIAWTMKLFIHAPIPIHSSKEFYDALAVVELPSWFVFGIYAGTIIASVALLVFVARTSSEEVNEFGNSNSSLWKV